MLSKGGISLFPLILLQAKAGGCIVKMKEMFDVKMFPLILLQAKAGGNGYFIFSSSSQELTVSINSPSGEGGGGEKNKMILGGLFLFPLILLQAKAGGPSPAPKSARGSGCFH